MKRFTQINDEKRICVTTEYEQYTDESYFEFEYPDDFDFSTQHDYMIQDGELVYSPPEPDPSVQIAELKQKLKETDYIPIKIAESQVTAQAIDDDRAARYADILVQREEWREQIRALGGD